MVAEREIVFRPVGVVRTQASDDEVRERSEEFESVIEIFPEFLEALDGLDGFSHIFVLSFLDRLRAEQIGPLKIRPRRLLRRGFKIEELPLVGVFAIDSPTRPNPIGLSLVKLLHREEEKLFVLGLDCFNGTPILDIKPYRDDYRTDQYELADWYRELRAKTGKDF
jgi:tRNA-Thr(GGU) m(6)t(6)A37 methyltransferase TsaA